MITRWMAAGFVALFALAAEDSDAAKRAGGGRDSGAQRPAASAAKNKAEDEVKTKRTMTPSINVSRPSGTGSAVPAVAAGAAVGAAAAAASRPAGALQASTADTEAARRQGEEKLKKAIEEEEKAKAAEQKRQDALAERERQDAEERKRLAKLEAEKKAKAEKEKRAAACQFKPVMSDEDIEKCRVAFR